MKTTTQKPAFLHEYSIWKVTIFHQTSIYKSSTEILPNHSKITLTTSPAPSSLFFVALSLLNLSIFVWNMKCILFQRFLQLPLCQGLYHIIAPFQSLKNTKTMNTNLYQKNLKRNCLPKNLKTNPYQKFSRDIPTKQIEKDSSHQNIRRKNLSKKTWREISTHVPKDIFAKKLWKTMPTKETLKNICQTDLEQKHLPNKSLKQIYPKIFEECILPKQLLKRNLHPEQCEETSPENLWTETFAKKRDILYPNHHY